jgi:hypothetical protein
MTTTILKTTIKEKFGSMTKFAKLIGMDRYELQKFFAAAEKKMTPEREEKLKKLADQAEKTSNKATEEDMTDALRDRIREEINNRGGATAFCEANPEFNIFSVRQAYNGNRLKITPAVRKLMKKLKIKH